MEIGPHHPVRVRHQGQVEIPVRRSSTVIGSHRFIVQRRGVGQTVGWVIQVERPEELVLPPDSTDISGGPGTHIFTHSLSTKPMQGHPRALGVAHSLFTRPTFNPYRPAVHGFASRMLNRDTDPKVALISPQAQGIVFEHWEI